MENIKPNLPQAAEDLKTEEVLAEEPELEVPAEEPEEDDADFIYREWFGASFGWGFLCRDGDFVYVSKTALENIMMKLQEEKGMATEEMRPAALGVVTRGRVSSVRTEQFREYLLGRGC